MGSEVARLTRDADEEVAESEGFEGGQRVDLASLIL